MLGRSSGIPDETAGGGEEGLYSGSVGITKSTSCDEEGQAYHYEDKR